LGRQVSAQPNSKLPLPTLSEESLQAAYAEPLPHFKDLAAADKQALFIKKLHLCAFTFDFTDQTKHVREKEVKRQTLLELVDYVNTGENCFPMFERGDVDSCHVLRVLVYKGRFEGYSWVGTNFCKIPDFWKDHHFAFITISGSGPFLEVGRLLLAPDCSVGCPWKLGN
jgi:hypothetical protein